MGLASCQLSCTQVFDVAPNFFGKSVNPLHPTVQDFSVWPQTREKRGTSGFNSAAIKEHVYVVTFTQAHRGII